MDKYLMVPHSDSYVINDIILNNFHYFKFTCTEMWMFPDEYALDTLSSSDPSNTDAIRWRASWLVLFTESLRYTFCSGFVFELYKRLITRRILRCMFISNRFTLLLELDATFFSTIYAGQIASIESGTDKRWTIRSFNFSVLRQSGSYSVNIRIWYAANPKI